MLLTQIKTNASKVECTSTTLPRPSSKSSQGSLYDQLLDGLSRLEYCGREVQIVMGLFEELGTAVHTDNPEYIDDRGIFSIRMDMDGHELLDVVMADMAIAADGSLHQLANKVFLPAGKTFIHDVTDFCVIEVRNVR